MSQVQASLLRGMFIDISKGYSVGKFDEKEIKIKHLNLEDQAKIDTFRQEYHDYAVKRGIPKEEDRLRVLDKQGFWTKTDEDKIFYSKDFITRLNATLNKIAVPSQRKALEDQIKDEQKKLNDLQEEKYGFVGKTAEIYANKRLNEYFIFYSMRKGDLNEMLFDESDFDELEEYQLNQLTHCFNTSVGNIDGLAIKKIALQPFFQNLFYLTDSIQEFWGKRILDLTIFQSDLSYWGKTFKNMINNSENRIPAEILSDPEKLISFMNLNNEAQKNLTNTQGELGAVSQVGATNEDYEKMGMKVDNSQAVWARKKLKETGKGSLTGREMAELRQTGGIKKWDQP